jgi:hypothetical protein
VYLSVTSDWDYVKRKCQLPTIRMPGSPPFEKLHEKLTCEPDSDDPSHEKGS